MPPELVSLDKIKDNPRQPRQHYDEQEMSDLAASISSLGVLMPVLLERKPDGEYILHDGHRRCRASRIAGKTHVPASIIHLGNNDVDDDKRLINALVANMQRSDLSLIEEANSFQLLQKSGYTIEQMSKTLGVSRAIISNRLLLLNLDEEIQALINSGGLPRSERVVRSLLSIDDKDKRIKLARTLSEKEAGIDVCVKAAAKLAESQADLHGKSPATTLVKKQPDYKEKVAAWNGLASLGQLPPWKIARTSAEKTCKDCALSDVANHQTCGECPLVQMLNNMLSATKKGYEKNVLQKEN